MELILTSLILLAMFLHILAIGSGISIINKYEVFFQELKHSCIFDIHNFYAHRMWFVLLSLFVSFGYLIFGAELFTRITGAFNDVYILKYVLMNMAVGVLILQYNYFILKDRRNIKKKTK